MKKMNVKSEASAFVLVYISVDVFFVFFSLVFFLFSCCYTYSYAAMRPITMAS